MLTSAILSTYNQPKWLKFALFAYFNQTDRDFEIVIADDGSTEETRVLIDEFKSSTSLNLKHIWHPDNGFQKCRILIRAIEAADGEYLTFLMGIYPRKDLLRFIRNIPRKVLLSGGYFKLPLDTSNRITKEVFQVVDVFDTKWQKRTEFQIRPNY